MRISKALAMSSAVAKVARPASMRNFIAPVIRKHFVIATVLSVVTTYGYYAAVFAPRREAYRQFYENYDPDKTYEQMKKTGFSKVPPKSPKQLLKQLRRQLVERRTKNKCHGTNSPHIVIRDINTA